MINSWSFMTIRVKTTVAFLVLMLNFMTASSADNDSIPDNPIGVQITANPCWVPTSDRQIKGLVVQNGALTLGTQLKFPTLPKHNDEYARDFGFPVFAMGINYNFYNHVKFHRGEDSNYLGNATPVDYWSTLGNSLSVYASFQRAIFRTQKWEFDYEFNIGLGFNSLKYNKYTQVDNHMISSNVNIYFGAGTHITYRIFPDWGIKFGLDFNHHSSGTLKRPNKGSNTIGPMVGLVYYPYYEEQLKTNADIAKKKFDKKSYLNFSCDVGCKTLYEDWNYTQFRLYPDDEDFRTNDFKLYTMYTLQADYMRRWQRRYASGFGLDLYYLSYINHVKNLDKQFGYSEKHSPISVGISGKHEVFYHQLSLAMSFGLYLFRQAGHKAKEVEQPFYETIGLKYHFPKFYDIALGAYVRAHAFKADHTGISISVPVK